MKRVETPFRSPFLAIKANESMKREEQIHSKSYQLEMPHSHAKIILKVRHRN